MFKLCSSAPPPRPNQIEVGACSGAGPKEKSPEKTNKPGSSTLRVPYLYESGRRQFDLVYAASSGACSAAYFVAGMWATGLTIWRELACNVVRKSEFLRHKPIIDLAYLVDYVMRKRAPLSVAALQKTPTEFFIVLTDCLTGEPKYFHACDERVFAALRATSSMALATRGYDFVDGKPYADGGVADPIPIKRAIADGATDITVVLTHNPAFRLKAVPRWMG
jgi:predicted patatin/cPLA2 family phospholipase